MTFPAALIDPGCQGSIVNQNGILYTSNANSTVGRTNMTVKTSTDQGGHWNKGVLVWSGPSAYSQLVPLGSSTSARLGLLFEAGVKSAYETISFVTVALE